MSRRVKSVEAALWGVAHRHNSIYSEGPDRLSCVDHPFRLPFIADCSGACICWWAWGGFNVSGLTYTGTLLTMREHLAKFHEVGKRVEKLNLVAADVVIFGAYPGVHAAFIVHAEDDPVIASHGKPGDPELTTVSAIQAIGPEYQEVTYLHFPFRRRLIPSRKEHVALPTIALKNAVLKNV